MRKRRICFILVKDEDVRNTRWYVQDIEDNKIKWTVFKELAAIYPDRVEAMNALIPALPSVENILPKYTVVLE